MIERRQLGYINTDDANGDLNELEIRDCWNLLPQKAGIGSSGRRETIFGMEQKDSLLGFTLPVGTNINIGTFQDKINERVFYFNYNSNNDHGVYVYDPTETTTGKISKVIESSILNWNDKSLVTNAGIIDGNLIFTDTENDIRMINVNHAVNISDVKEKRKFVLVFDRDAIKGASAITLTVNFTVPVNVILSTVASDADDEDIDTVLDTWVTEINTAVPGTPASRCGDTIEYCEETAGEVASIDSSNTTLMQFSPTNHYALPFVERYINLANQPVLCPPTFEFQIDPVIKSNFIDDIQFQFRARFVYFDNSKSALSPISAIAFVRKCGDVTPATNCIEIEFNETEYSVSEMSIVKNVELFFREGNLGNWKQITSLSREEYFTGKYSFYNDGNYNTVPDIEANKLFDAVPFQANALATIKNRLFLGGITEGRDTPCLEATLDPDINDVNPNADQQLWTISGLCRIINVFVANDIFKASQPIWQGVDSGGQTVYGGFGVTDYVNQVGEKFEQYIPQGGFTIYLDGTNFRGTSKQVFKNDGTPSDFNDPPEVYDAGGPGDNNPNRQRIRDIIDGGNRVLPGTLDEQSAYSQFFIDNVPPGRYILRVASHKVYEGDTPSHIDDPTGIYRLDTPDTSYPWQKTSANVVRTNETITDVSNNKITISGDNAISPEGVYEIILELGPNGGTYDISTELGEVITIGDFSDPTIPLTDKIANTFYVRDLNVSKSADITLSTSVELSNFFVDTTIGFNIDRELVLDHNGYCFVSSNSTFKPRIYSGETLLKDNNDNVMFEDTSIHDIGVTDFTQITPQDQSNVVIGPLAKVLQNYIVMSVTDSVRDNSRTRVTGKVVDSSGNPVIDALVTIDRTNKFQRTDAAGCYDILVFSESDSSGTTNTRNVTVFINGSLSECLVDNDPLELAKKVLVGNITINSMAPPNYNNDNPFSVGTTVVSITNYLVTSAYKRGGVYQWGVIYMDDYLRSSFVATKDRLKLTIPYYTEDLNKFYPDKYPNEGTYRYGDPIIGWEINSDPPEWATQYFWVRTKNTALNFYIQWVAKEILYVINYDSSTGTMNDTTYANGDANEIYISIGNILDYADRNTDSQLGYTFQDGDKLIIIQNESDYLTDYIELEIKGQRGDYVIIDNLGMLPELKNNFIFEIYTPKLQVESEFFYEFGPCYKIENGFHTGQTQDQTVSQPAKGTFSGGDTYKTRRIVPIDGGDVVFTFDSANISDAVTTMDSDIGRPNIENRDARQIFRDNAVRFSNQVIEDSYVNGIPTFDTLDEEVVGFERGPIRKMVATTDNILVIHERESTVLRIREAYLNTPDGSGILSQTDKVIGDDYELVGEFGTVNPESVVEFDDVIYWYDARKSEAIRYSNNGLTPIAKNLKAKEFFINLEKERNAYRILNPTVTDRVYGGFDPVRSQFILSFNDLGDGNRYVPIFAERPNQWIGQVSYFGENFVNIGNFLYSFKDGVIWEHDVDSVNQNRFYGVQYFPSFKMVSNMENFRDKIYRGTGIKSNVAWNVPVITNPDGQQSRLVKNNFKLRDNEYYADFLRDENTNLDQLTGLQTPLTHGQVLRSQLLELEFSTDETGYIYVEDVTIRFQSSPGHHIDYTK